MGSDISLVDVTFAPMIERATASLAYYKGYYMRGEGRWPAIDKWFEAMELLPEYLGTKSDFYTHCHDLPPQLGGGFFTLVFTAQNILITRFSTNQEDIW